MHVSKPMLAATLTDLKLLRYPCLLTPKLDGIRCLKLDGKAVTRSFKPVPNRHIRHWVEENLPDGIDGELMVDGSFGDVQSAVMSHDGCPQFYYAAFDLASDEPYTKRVVNMTTALRDISNVKLIEPSVCRTEAGFLAYEENVLASNFEGVMVRSPGGPYKCGRSSLSEQYLLKYKRVVHGEAYVLGFEEAMENRNEIVPDAFGYATRPGGQGAMVGKDTLGSFLLRDVESGVEFSCGTGLDDSIRRRVWDDRNSYLGSVVRYKYQSVGVKERPRFPTFLGFREAE